MKTWQIAYISPEGKRETHDFYAKFTAVALLCAKDLNSVFYTF